MLRGFFKYVRGRGASRTDLVRCLRGAFDFVGARLAREGALKKAQFSANAPTPCRSEPARDER